MTYQVNEIFTSVQGEGVHTGIPATFIRLQGCTVGCPWCDSGPLADKIWGRQTNGETRNTWGKGGSRMTVEEILSHVPQEVPWVIITGGEPTMYNLDELIQGIGDHFDEEEVIIQLETSGQNALKGEMHPDWITWSPKQNLGWEAPEDLKVMASEVKFVVDDELDIVVIERVEMWYATHTLSRPPIVLMPEGCPPSQEHINKALRWVKLHPEWRVMDRLQYRLGIR